ncbi:unannotated protein [freshwater metagenome]|uniref:Unannotated protein n=1 Tax=freshwater metagenome TaxID=449393 RepID=A0A6J7D4B1_9ZZZZ
MTTMNRPGPTNPLEAADTSAPQQAVSRRRLLALAGGAALLGACSSSAKKPAGTVADTAVGSSAPTTSAASTTTPAPTTVAAAPVPVEPLTGRALADPALLSRAALVVKVSNDPGARPQTGLNDPDIIFEAWGAGPTRFATIWHSRDLDFVGPIRSCREQDVNLVGEFNRAVFACSGGNPGNLALLRSSDLLLVTEGQGPGWELDPNRSRPHKTHANTALLRSNAGPDRTAPAQQFHYRPVGQASVAGDPMTGFDLQIQQVFVQWRYDTASGTYLRAQDRHPHMLSDGNQVSTDNVVIVWLDYDPSHTDNRSPDGITTGSNPALVFTGGRLILGTWTRNDRLEPFALNDAAGAPILLTPGRTFIELPNSGKGSFRGNDSFTPVA